jgi:hypothetical protein
MTGIRLIYERSRILKQINERREKFFSTRESIGVLLGEGDK